MSGESAVSAQIPRATFSAMVRERIRAAIIDGTLTPGSQLSEVVLARTFGVSRGPVREALQRLIQEGLLHSEPHRGVFVPVMRADDIDDIYLARSALETAAIGRVVGSSMARETSARLEAVVAAMDKAARVGDWDAVVERDLEFHAVLVGAARSPRLDRMFSTVMSETRLCLIMLAGVFEVRHDLVQEHRAISDCIRAENVEGALTVLKSHYDNAVSSLTERLGTAQPLGSREESDDRN